MERIRQAVEQAKREREKSTSVSERLGELAEVASTGQSAAADSSTGSFRYTQTPTIEVSQAVRSRNRLVAAIDGHALRDTYRMLRTQIMQEMIRNNWNTIAVTSPATGSGKTLTAINLAITLGRDLSHTALLVDGDLRRPTVHKYFEYQPEYGLNDFLFNDVPLNKLFFHPDMDRLTVLPGRLPVGESAEMLASPKIISMLNEIKSRYSDRLIVIDIAPVLSVDDALVLAPNIDCMLVVAEAGETTREDLSRSIELLAGIPIVGTVLNKVSKKVAAPY